MREAGPNRSLSAIDAPHHRRAPVIAWDERHISRIGRDQYVVAIPCLVGSLPSGLNVALAERLRRSWTAGGTGEHWDVKSVVAAVGPDRRVVLGITAEVACLGAPPLDDLRMAYDLQRALTEELGRDADVAGT